MSYDPLLYNDILPTPVAVASGGTNATTSSSVRSSFGFAKSGVNTDITTLNNLVNLETQVQYAYGNIVLTSTSPGTTVVSSGSSVATVTLPAPSSCDGQIFVVCGEASSLIGTESTGHQTSGLGSEAQSVPSPDGSICYLATQGHIVYVNTTNYTVVGSASDLSGNGLITDMVINAAGTKIWVMDSDTSTIYKFDVASQLLEKSSQTSTSAGAGFGMALSADESVLYCAQATGGIIAVNPTTLVYLGSTIAASDHSLEWLTATPNDHIWVNNLNGFAVYRASTGALLQTFTAGSSNKVRSDSVGNVYASWVNGSTGMVTVYDDASITQKNQFPMAAQLFVVNRQGTLIATNDTNAGRVNLYNAVTGTRIWQFRPANSADATNQPMVGLFDDSWVSANWGNLDYSFWKLNIPAFNTVSVTPPAGTLINGASSYSVTNGNTGVSMQAFNGPTGPNYKIIGQQLS